MADRLAVQPSLFGHRFRHARRDAVRGAFGGHSSPASRNAGPQGGRTDRASIAQEGYLLGSVLGLLGLLLAFSFGMVLNRYEDAPRIWSRRKRTRSARPICERNYSTSPIAHA